MKRFYYVFQLTKKVIFEVRFGGLNENPYFATTSSVFNQPKTDYIMCGQCQRNTLFGKAFEFWEKWDKCHLKQLNERQYAELISDIEMLKNEYNYLEGNDYEVEHDRISFYKIKEFSKMKPKAI